MSCLIILLSTVFEVCIVAYNPCLSGINEIGFFINIGMTFIAMVNLGYCFKFDLGNITTKNVCIVLNNINAFDSM